MKEITKDENFNVISYYRCGKSIGVVLKVYTAEGDVLVISTLIGSYAKLRELVKDGVGQARGKYRRALDAKIVDVYKARPKSAGPWQEDAATDAQIDYVLALASRIHGPWNTCEAHVVLAAPTRAAAARLTKGEASQAIDLLKMCA